MVLGPGRIPVVTSASVAQRSPELAVLSVLAHGRGDRGLAIGRAALHAAANLDEERRALYTDFILFASSVPTRKALEITDYEFKSEFFKRKIAQAAERAEARALLKFLAARGLTVSDEQQARILVCTDIPTLDRWVERAATAATTDAVLRDGP